MRTTAIKEMGLTEWSLLIVLSALWGGSFFFSKVALAELRPFTVVLGRVAVAAVALNLVVRATGHRMPRSLQVWGMFLVMGLLNNLIPFSLIFWGQTRISSGLAAILNATTPLWTILIAHLVTTDERITPNRLGGVLLGLVGVVVVIGPDVIGGSGSNLPGKLAVLGAAVSYAIAGIYGKRFKGVPPNVTAAGQITCSTLLMIPIALFVDRPWQLAMPTMSTWASLLALALLSTAVAYSIYFRLLSTAGATNLLLVTLLIPVSALLLGMGILGEQMDLRYFLGMGLIGLGLAVIDGRLLRRARAHFRNSRVPQAPLADDGTV